MANPAAYSVFDSNGGFLAAVVVNGTNPAYVNFAQVLEDAETGKPVTLGQQVAVEQANVLAFKPLGTNDPTTQWIVSADLIVNTPAWPSLITKYGFKVVPLTLVGDVPAPTAH